MATKENEEEYRFAIATEFVEHFLYRFQVYIELLQRGIVSYD